MRISTSILTTMFVLLLSSCEKEITFNGEQSKDMLVINSLVKADEAVTARVSRSIFFLNPTYGVPTFVNDAVLELFVNDVSQGQMQYTTHSQPSALYTSSYVARQGDRITIKARHNYYDAVAASTYVPYATTINSVTASYSDGNYGHKQVNFNINFDDNGNTTDFYEIEIFAFTWSTAPNPSREYVLLYGIYSNDIVFGNTTVSDPFGYTYQNRVSVFDDYLINGKQYTLNVFVGESYAVSDNDSLEIRLKTVSRDYYLYRKSLDAYNNNDEFLEIFGEPVQIYTNVEGGIGLVAGLTDNIFRIKRPTP